MDEDDFGYEYDEGSDIDNWEDEQVFRDGQEEMRQDEAREEAADRNEPPAGSWAATARVMASLGGDDDFDWDQWKDDMKEG